MAIQTNSKTILTSGDDLTFNVSGDYTIDFSKSFVQIKLEGGQMTNLSDKAWDTANDFDVRKVNDLNVTGINFTQAGAETKFEIDVNLDDLIGNMLVQKGMDATIDALTVNGNRGDAFRVLWDYLDDAYVAGNNYYNIPLNEFGVLLGVAYWEYLQDGGKPLWDIAKFSTGTRSQYLHDNLLGNTDILSIEDKFSADPAKRDQLKGLVTQAGLADRPYFSGNLADNGGATKAWDEAKGIDRPDYDPAHQTYSPDANLGDTAHDANNNVFFGLGNSAADYSVTKHLDAGVELGLKVHYRTGDTVEHDGVSGQVAHYTVDTGYQQDGVHNASGTATNRAAWSFDYSVDVGNTAMGKFDFKLLVDIDRGAGVSYKEFIYQEDVAALGGADAWITADGTSIIGDSVGSNKLAQDSVNFGFSFLRNAIDNDGNSANGIQPYDFVAGTFDIKLQAFANGTNYLIAENHIQISVAQPVVDV